MSDVVIGSRRVGLAHEPFIVAELSGNHNRSLDRALELIKLASKAGAQAVKLQTYTADSLTIKSDKREFMIEDADSLWNRRSLYELYQEAATPYEWHEPIFALCRELGIECFSTPFDAAAVDFLEQFNPPAYKIASFENVDLPLIAKVAATGRPLIISTGMAHVGEIQEAVAVARKNGCRDLILLKCTSSYPATPADTNVRTIPHMRALFGCEVGLSDHTMGIGVATAAVALGATFIEKHFTVSRNDGGVDSAFSLEPDELRQLVEETRRAHQALGEVSYGPIGKEAKSLQFRRSIYVVQDVAENEPLSAENIRIIRPGFGLAPKFYDIVLGRRVNRALTRGTALSWEHL